MYVSVHQGKKKKQRNKKIVVKKRAETAGLSKCRVTENLGR
jgi:hypothetical protein